MLVHVRQQPEIVIASGAKQSRGPANPDDSGLFRRRTPRNDELDSGLFRRRTPRNDELISRTGLV